MGLVIDKALGRELIHEHPVTLAASDPSTTKEGLLYYNTTDGNLYIYYNSAWVAVGASASDGTFDFMDGNDLQFMDGNSAAFMAG